MIFCGIDPGQKGAVALIDTNDPELPFFIDMPLIDPDDRDGIITIDSRKLSEALGEWLAGKDVYDYELYVEELFIMRAVQTAGLRTFLADYGNVLSVLQQAGIRYRTVHPTTWQAALCKPKTKEGSIWLAQKLFPKANLVRDHSRTPSDGRADALLIAEYGKRLYKVRRIER
ncbi:MAG: hypothetical protein K2Y22_04415 [Candidatus Obscuribacterales bacterium]|nr:hypothetical protein [Candidatus Obscuribacterales bacterium]